MPTLADKLREHRKARPTLTLAMIVKNEAETLEKCLRLARPHVDEIVIVDTGSTDGTQEIARRYADTYDEIEWPNSFSKARNHSLDLVTGDYTLIVDGDEYIEGAENWQRIHRTIRRPGLVGAQLIQHNLMGEEGLLRANREWADRLFLSHPAIRFVGRVHNQIMQSIQNYIRTHGGEVHRVGADIMHGGYALDKERAREKYAPRIELLRAEYGEPRSEITRAYYGYQLGVMLTALDEWESSLDVLEEIDYERLTRENAYHARLKAAESALHLKHPGRAAWHGDKALEINRDEPVAYFLTALALLRAGEVLNGLLLLTEAYTMNEAQEGAVRFVLQPTYVLGILGKLCAGAHLDEYAAAFNELKDGDPPQPDAVQAVLEHFKTKLILAEAQQAEVAGESSAAA